MTLQQARASDEPEANVNGDAEDDLEFVEGRMEEFLNFKRMLDQVVIKGKSRKRLGRVADAYIYVAQQAIGGRRDKRTKHCFNKLYSTHAWSDDYAEDALERFLYKGMQTVLVETEVPLAGLIWRPEEY